MTEGQRRREAWIDAYFARYPKIQLVFSLSDRTINMIEEGFDLAIRIGELEDSSLAARKLAPNRRVVCASPAYLAAHGAPRTPDELAQHNCLVTDDFVSSWEYKDPAGRAAAARVQGRYASDNWEVLREWALAGLGIALKSTWDIYRQLQNGSLVALFPGYTFHSDVAIYAVYPHRRFLPAKTRVFIEFLAASFGPDPYWDATPAGPKPRIRPRRYFGARYVRRARAFRSFGIMRTSMSCTLPSFETGAKPSKYC